MDERRVDAPVAAGESSIGERSSQYFRALVAVESPPHHDPSPGAAPLRLRGGDHPLVGGRRHDHFALPHPSRGRQHDLYQPHRQGQPPLPAETPLIPTSSSAPSLQSPQSPSSSSQLPSPQQPSSSSNRMIGVSLDGSAEPLSPEMAPSTSSQTAIVPAVRRERPRIKISALWKELRSCFSRSIDSDGEGPSVPQPSPSWFVHQRVMAARNGVDPPVHKIVEFTYELVPHLDSILAAPYYWGLMDRFQAEKLLDGKPEGTFLLRDSAQPEFIFSVSFRRYGRTLHARIEQANGSFGFDVLDSSVFAAPSITKLVENYNHPERCLFFEPQLTNPLHRTFPFTLQELARAKIAAHSSYVEVQNLAMPPHLREYLAAYHYSTPVRTTLTATGPGPSNSA